MTINHSHRTTLIKQLFGSHCNYAIFPWKSYLSYIDWQTGTHNPNDDREIEIAKKSIDRGYWPPPVPNNCSLWFVKFYTIVYLLLHTKSNQWQFNPISYAVIACQYNYRSKFVAQHHNNVNSHRMTPYGEFIRVYLILYVHISYIYMCVAKWRHHRNYHRGQQIREVNRIDKV